MHCLPQPGGLLDQDSLFVHGMDLVVEAQEAKRELDDLAASKKKPGMG